MIESAAIAEHVAFAAMIVVLLLVALAAARAIRDFCLMLDSVEDDER